MSEANPPAFDSATFDPFTQNFTLLLADGSPFIVGLADVESFVLYKSQVCINFGCQMGATLIMLIIMLLMSNSKKRHQPVFLTNVLSLALAFIASSMQAIFFVSPWSLTYVYLASDFSRIPSHEYVVTITNTVISLLLVCTVETSLVLQIEVITRELRSLHRVALMSLCFVVALLTITFRFVQMVLNDILIMGAQAPSSLRWITSANLVMQTVSIAFFSLIFIAKLVATIFARRKMNMRQWGPMEMICIGTGCTMIIPGMSEIQGAALLPGFTFSSYSWNLD
jgi:pheromone alpha factor receptor